MSITGEVMRVPCISLREPFCSLLLHGFKKLETRKWPGDCALVHTVKAVRVTGEHMQPTRNGMRMTACR